MIKGVGARSIPRINGSGSATLLSHTRNKIKVKTGATGSNLEMDEGQMVEAVGAGGKGAAAQGANNSVFSLKYKKIIINFLFKNTCN
jgi:hypothetical protein